MNGVESFEVVVPLFSLSRDNSLAFLQCITVVFPPLILILFLHFLEGLLSSLQKQW